jgi:hypothetical protein
MRKILGFGVVLTAAYLIGTVGMAYGQQRAPAPTPNAIANQAINTAVQGTTATPDQTAGVGANTAAPTNAQVPGTAGNVLNQTGVTGAAPGKYQVPGTAGNVMNRAGVTGTSPANTATGTAAPGTPYMVNPAQGNYATNAASNAAPGMQQGTYPGTATGATPGYTGRVMPGMTGYNTVNPMGTTMAPGYYYAGTAGMPYATYNTPGYVTPGSYSTQTGPYVVQRRGLFGRRNRIVYPASPYGYTTYGTNPSGYTTYGTTTYYTTPGAYTYGNRTYTTTGGFTYGGYPY